MVARRIKKDLFTVTSDYYLAHCISADYALGAGIAKIFNQKFNMREKLFKKFPLPASQIFTEVNVGRALLIDNVFNLVTKNRYFNKPTYDSLKQSLIDMKRQCLELGILKVAMPMIGCGLDRLEWQYVREIILEVFNETDIEILVCVKE